VPGNGSVLGLRGPLADQDLRGDELLAAAAAAGPWDTECASGAQARGQLAAQRSTSLDVQGLVDGLVRDAHGPIIGEIDREPARDLLRAPGGGPASVLPAPVTATDPAHLRAGHGRPTCRRDRAREPVLHVLAQRVVGGQLGHLRPPCLSIGVPLRGRGPVLQAPTAGRGVAAQLPGDGRGVPAQLTGDLADPCALGPKDRDLFPFRERQVAARQRGQTDRRHAATLTEPPHSHRRRHTSLPAGVLARQPSGDRLPEPLPILTARHRRPPRRPHRRPTRQTWPPPSGCSHRNTSLSRCCDDQLNPPSTR
jgi:hypothetical protein